MRAACSVRCGTSKISETFRASSFVSLVFFVRFASTLSAQTPDRHWLGGAFACAAVVGHLVWLGSQSRAHDRKHGGSRVDDRSTAAAHACAENAPPKNTSATAPRTHQHGTSHYASAHATCSSACRPRHSHRSRHSAWSALRQARLPQRLPPHGRGRHCHAEVFDWCGWQSHSSRH